MSTPGERKGVTRQRPPEVMGGLAKGLAIIELFDGTRNRITAAEAARITGLSRATARRCLLTLTELGYVARREDQHFTPRARLLRLGRGYVQPLSFAEGAQPILDDARDILQEPVSVTVLEGIESVFIARAETSRVVTTGVGVGGRLPVYCSATGRILVGDLNQEELQGLLSRSKLVARTPKTCVSIPSIVDIIETARRNNVAYSDEEIELGMRAMAVPILGSDNRIRAALSVSTSSARVSLDEMATRYLAVLRDHAEYLCELIRTLPFDNSGNQ